MNAPIVIVAGLGRCGTSMVMQMLHAGGLPCAGEYPGFEDPRSEAMDLDYAWLNTLPGRAVKILDPHRARRPLPTSALVIWIDRSFEQQARSQVKFINSMFPLAAGNRDTWRAIKSSLKRERPLALDAVGFGVARVLVLNFENILANPAYAATQIGSHLARGGLSIDAVRAAAVVRSRSPDCYPGLLELQQLDEARP